MKVLKTDNKKSGFYALLGPVFGSRAVEKATHDRFYDENGKVWYVYGKSGAASVLDGCVKNFWADDDEAADCLLREITSDYETLTGIVPKVYDSAFMRAGFRLSVHSKNFMEVYKG